MRLFLCLCLILMPLGAYIAAADEETAQAQCSTQLWGTPVCIDPNVAVPFSKTE